MTSSERQKSRLKRLETLFWVAGIGMLGAFLLIRGTQESAGAQGIETFEQARSAAVERLANSVVSEARAGQTTADSSHAHSRTNSLPPVESHTTRSGGGGLTSTSEPDFSDWSEKRITEYRESLEASSELPLAVLNIDRLNIRVPVYNGASDLNLNRGVARIKGTARIHEPGNLGIAGHRDGFFRGLQHISVGDHIELDTMTGQVRFRVTGITIVNPEDVYVLEPTESRTLTLVTCYPFYFVGSAPQRYIVTAEAEIHQVPS